MNSRPIRYALLLAICLSSSIQAAIFRVPSNGDDIVGQNFTVEAEPGDTFIELAREYDLSYHELTEANPDIEPRLIRIGEPIVIPSQYILPRVRKGITINIAELRLYYFTDDGRFVITHPVGLGRDEWRTPTVSTRVVRKKVYPTWHVPESIREHVFDVTGKILPDQIEPGPENPLGDYAMYLSKNGYLIHGTNQPYSIGKFVSSGCIRLNNDAVESLFQVVKVGTPVRIVHHPIKAGWLNGELYLEAHIPVDLDEEEPTDLNDQSMEHAIREATKHHPAKIYWDIADQVVNQKQGVPEPIGHATTYY